MFIEFSEQRKEKIQLKHYEEPKMEITFITWADIITSSNPPEAETKTIVADEGDFNNGD